MSFTDRIKKYNKELVVYGAGVRGRKIMRYLNDIVFPCNTFMVSNRNNNSMTEFKICEPAELVSKREEILIIVGVSAKYVGDVIETIESTGYEYILPSEEDIAEIEDYLFAKDGGSQSYWEKRYLEGGTSGAGSYDNLALFKAEILNQFVEEFQIKTVCEWGCGDGNQLSLAKYPCYVGYDVSKTAISLCCSKFRDKTEYIFVQYDGGKVKITKKVELALSMDVIFHLIEDTVYKTYLMNLFGSSKRFVCIYAGKFGRRIASHIRDRDFVEYISRNFADWRMIRHIPNKYPYDATDDVKTSVSEFYFYQKVTDK